MKNDQVILSVNINIQYGSKGTKFPVGTWYKPVNNLLDALKIAGQSELNVFRWCYSDTILTISGDKDQMTNISDPITRERMKTVIDCMREGGTEVTWKKLEHDYDIYFEHARKLGESNIMYLIRAIEAYCWIKVILCGGNYELEKSVLEFRLI